MPRLDLDSETYDESFDHSTLLNNPKDELIIKIKRALLSGYSVIFGFLWYCTQYMRILRNKIKKD